MTGSPFAARWRQATALDRATAGGRALDWDRRPEPHKAYPGARRIPLPSPPLAGAPGDLWACLARRRSCRDFGPAGLAPGDLAALLWAAHGVTAQHGPYGLRTAPSAGALYPFETYLSLHRVDSVAPCLAHFHLPSGSLEVLAEGDHGPALARAALGQGFLAEAAVAVVWTAVLPRAAWKYEDRALRYLGLDLGHAAQNLTVAAEALGLGCCMVAAFFDEDLNRLLGVDGEDEFAYYCAALGPRATG